MRQAKIFFDKIFAGVLTEIESGKNYIFEYDAHYDGAPISLTLPIHQKKYEFQTFPSFFDGLLPEGPLLEALLRQAKCDRDDYLGQLITVGADLVGAITVEALT